MYLIKEANGNFIPYDDQDHEESKKTKVGEIVKVSKARNYKHHKKAFALLKVGFDNQERYESAEIYRKVMTIIAGFYDEVADPDGVIHHIPHSISFEAMSQARFEEWYDATMNAVAFDLGITKDELEYGILEGSA